MSPRTNKGKNTGYLVAPSKVTLVFELSTFEDIPVLDTTSGAQILRGADQAGHKSVGQHAESSPILLLSSSGFWTFGSAILRNTDALRRLWKTSRRKRC